MVMLFQSLVYSMASAVVWGLVLFAIFGPNGIVRSHSEPDSDNDLDLGD